MRPFDQVATRDRVQPLRRSSIDLVLNGTRTRCRVDQMSDERILAAKSEPVELTMAQAPQ